ncbi:hypothetical protein ACWOAH_10405 [Vagococcus vulneris]|nr:hypothetical protein [Vagococcus vulneris]
MYQDAYRKSHNYAVKMLIISIKNLFLKTKLGEARYEDDERWKHMKEG